MKRRPGIARFAFEKKLWKTGIVRVAGVDEAGRGPLAGPVVAAAVIFPQQWSERRLPRILWGLNDSKQLIAEEREKFFSALMSLSEIQLGIARVESARVDEINILQATYCAMNEALAKLSPPPEHVLMDGTRAPRMRWPYTPIIKGDSRSYSIAAASILAKVTRDRLMTEHHRQWPMYGFAAHKGYSTPEHLAALAQHGPCPIHRRSFAPVSSAVPMSRNPLTGANSAVTRKSPQ